jgi:hypothetical protein
VVDLGRAQEVRSALAGPHRKGHNAVVVRRVRVPRFGVDAFWVLLVFGALIGLALVASVLVQARESEAKRNAKSVAIPIPDRACPYIQSVRRATSDASQGWDHVMGAPTKRWKRFERQLIPNLAAYELSLRTAIPHTPPALADELRATLRDVRVGRAHLGEARTFDEYNGITHNAFYDGVLAIARANALVGDACGGLGVPF